MRQGLRSRAIAFSWAGAALVLAILAALNVVAWFAYLRLDFSEGRIYSVSSGTKAILRDLKDNLVIKAYCSGRLPPPYGVNAQYLKSLLAEYRSAGRGRVKVEFVNPEGSDAARKEALAAGIQEFPLNVMGRDKLELRRVMMGMILMYKGKTEAIPIFGNTTDFEYDITRKIRKMSQPRRKTVGFAEGHGEKGPGGGPLSPVFDLLGETVDVVPVDLAKPVPAAVDSLWVFGPQRPLAAAEVERLKAWAGAGRSLGLLVDQRMVDFKSFFTMRNDSGLDGLLKAWGVEIRDGLVVDSQAEQIQMEQQAGMFVMTSVIEYPFIPVVTNINPRHPATRGLSSVSLPFVHPISFKGGALRYTSLLDSSAQSWFVTENQVSPYKKLEDIGRNPKGPFSLAGVLEGDFSAAAPSTATAVEAPPGLPAAPAGAPGRVVLVGTSRLIHPGLALKPANVALLLNLIEWSLQDEALLSIRSRGVSYRYLRQLSDGGRFAAKNVMIFTLPLCLAAAGLAVYRRQRARAKGLRAEYGR